MYLFDPRTVQTLASRYTDYAIPAQECEGAEWIHVAQDRMQLRLSLKIKFRFP